MKELAKITKKIDFLKASKEQLLEIITATDLTAHQAPTDLYATASKIAFFAEKLMEQVKQSAVQQCVANGGKMQLPSGETLKLVNGGYGYKYINIPEILEAQEQLDFLKKRAQMAANSKDRIITDDGDLVIPATKQARADYLKIEKAG